MVYDLNGWGQKAQNTDDPIEKSKYFQLWRDAKQAFHEEFLFFLEQYDDSNNKFTINKEYLDQVIDEITNGNFYIPYVMRSYLVREYGINAKKLNKIYRDKWWNRSALSTGVKLAESILGSPKSSYYKPRLLMFEVWEFTLTYPEYSDLFVEEWVGD